MAGKVHKAALFGPWRIVPLLPDLRTLRFWYIRLRRDNKDDTLLLGLIAEFARDGLRFELGPGLLPGVARARRRADPPPPQRGGGERHRLRLGAGQGDGPARRRPERRRPGPGRPGRRGHRGDRPGHRPRRRALPPGGFVVVKVAKPQQDMRFDVPTVGCTTIETMHQAGGRVLAIEAGKTILLDEPATVALADRYGITIVAVEAVAVARAA